MSSDVTVEQQSVTTMTLGRFGNNTSQGHCCATMCFNDETGYSVAKVCPKNGNTVPIFRNNTLFTRVTDRLTWSCGLPTSKETRQAQKKCSSLRLESEELLRLNALYLLINKSECVSVCLYVQD
jgi:hypothetical protein